MDMVLVRCQCGTVLKAPRNYVGRTATCKACGCSLIVQDQNKAETQSYERLISELPLMSEPSPPIQTSKLITCPDCGRPISKSAHTCPQCGAPNVFMDVGSMKKEKKRGKHMRIALYGSLFALILSAFFHAVLRCSASEMTLSISAIVAAAICFLVIGGMPGHIARSRAHPQAEAITVCGWLGMFTFGILWIVAIVWAYTHNATTKA